MLLHTDPAAPRDMEDALRSLGAVLDIVRARSVLIREARWGLVLRAQVAAPGGRAEGRWGPIEREMTADDMERHRQEARARRGTGHVAGPHERSLRMVGRLIDDRDLSGVTLIQHPSETGWLLWHGLDPVDGPHLLLLEEGQLLTRDVQERDARLARERVSAIAMETGRIHGR